MSGMKIRAYAPAGGPSLAEVALSNATALCNRWLDQPTGEVWREQAANEILAAMDTDPVSDLGIVGLNVENGEATLDVASCGPASQATLLAVVAAIGDLLHTENPPNYVEFEVIQGTHSYIAHVRTGDRPSPHTLRRQAEQRITAALDALDDHADDPTEVIARARAVLREQAEQ